MSELLVHYRAILTLRFLTKNPDAAVVVCHPKDQNGRLTHPCFFPSPDQGRLCVLNSFEYLKAAVLTGNQTINERYDGASSFGIDGGKAITHTLLNRRVAGALLRILLLLSIAHHVELLNTLFQA